MKLFLFIKRLSFMKVIKIIFFVITSFFLYSKNLELSVERAIELAYKNNLDLKSEFLSQRDRIVSLIANINKIFPSSNFSSSLSSSRILSTPDSKYTNSLSMGFDVTLSLNLKIAFEIYQSILDYNEGKINLDKAKNELKKNIKKSYFFIVVYEEKIKIKEFELEAAKEKYNIILPAYQRGEVSEIEKLNAELAYKRLFPELLKMKDELDYQKKVFNLLIGINEDDRIIFIDKLPDFSNLKIEKLHEIKYENSFDYKLLLMQLNKAKNNLNLSIASITPSLKVSYTFNSSFLKDPYYDLWFRSNDDWQHKQTFILSLTVPLDPILPFSSKLVDLWKYSTNIERQNIALFQKKRQAQNELEYKILKVKENLEILNNLKLNIDIADKAYKLTEKEYYNGHKTFLELKETEKNLLEARVNYLNARFELFSYLADIEAIANLDLNRLF